MAQRKKRISKSAREKIYNITLLITYIIYLITSTLFIINARALSDILMIYFTLYPFLFTIYIYKLKDKVLSLPVYEFIKYIILAALGIIALVIIVGLTEAISGFNEQILRGFASIYISFLMLAVIVFDLLLIKEIKKILKKKKRKKSTTKRKTNN